MYVGEPDEALGGALLLVVSVGLIVAMGVVALLVTAGRRGVRPLVLLPVAVVTVVVLLLTWAQASGKVPETPTGTSP